MNFLKRDPFEKNPKRFFFLYPWGVLRLFYLINFLIGACLEPPGPGFVFGENSANFSKIKIKFFGRTPCVKNPKRFSFWYPQTSLILFYLIRFLVGASFQGSGSGFVFAEGAKIVKKSVKKASKAHVRLLGPCFKTGRSNQRPTRQRDGNRNRALLAIRVSSNTCLARSQDTQGYKLGL